MKLIRIAGFLLALVALTGGGLADAQRFRPGLSPGFRSGFSFIVSLPVVVPVTRVAADKRLVGVGDSNMAGAFGPAFFDSIVLGSGGRLSYQGATAYSQAISGVTAATLADPAYTSLVVAENPAIVVYHAGTNDLGLTNDAPGTVYANIMTAAKAYIDGGASFVVVNTLLPRGKENALPAAREADRGTLNSALLAFNSDASLGAYRAKIRVVNIEPQFDLAADTIADGLHLSWTGSRKQGLADGAAIAELVTPARVQDLYTDASNLVTNRTFAGTGGFKGFDGNITGDLADGWRAYASNASLLVDVTKTTLDGAPAQKFVITRAASAQDATFTIDFHPLAINGVAGDRFEAWFYVRLEGTTNVRSMYLHSDGAAVNSPNFNAPTQFMDGVPAVEGVLRTYMSPPLTGAVSTDAIGLVLFFGALPAGATLTISKPFYRKVAAGQ